MNFAPEDCTELPRGSGIIRDSMFECIQKLYNNFGLKFFFRNDLQIPNIIHLICLDALSVKIVRYILAGVRLR